MQSLACLCRNAAAGSRSLFRPRFLHSANALPRVAPSALRLLSLSARAVLFYFSLMRNVHPLPLNRGYREGAGCARCPKFAIQYGKHTAKHGQYTNPNVTL